MDSIHPGQQSPPSLRSLQPAILHHFHHTQEDQALGSVQALAAAAGAFGLHPADQTSLLQQGFLSQVSDPSRSLRQPGAYVDQHGRPSSHLDTISNLQQQSFLPTAPNVTQFGFGPAQSQPFGLGNFARPQASEHVQIQEPGPTVGDEADANAAKDDNHPNPVPNPPGLAAWRDRLFYLDETIVMTEDQFKTYWPHVDNVYSHRSTQRYKRKPFVSHYWDCRLKGRPPGTPKSDDPNKKKRKRVARERDLCDVKVKITEYEPGAATPDSVGNLTEQVSNLASSTSLDSVDLGPVGPGQQNQQWPFSARMSLSPFQGKIFTIQRVNGNGANGKVDGNPGPHRHSLQDSDRIKKNSVVRWVQKNEKSKRKPQESQTKQDDKKSYHTKATGKALATVKRHSTNDELKLFGSCFCPFVQRVWISLEYKKIPYQYIEVDPYKKPQSLLEVNPRGLVPALRHGDWGCYESTVLMEYLEDLRVGRALMPADAKARAHCRLWSDHVNRHIIPVFYRFLQEQDAAKQIEHAAELKTQISKLVDAADPVGPFFLGADISYVDIQFAPWIVRLNRVLKPYRGWPEPEPGSRWGKLVDAVERHESVQATMSTDELYLDSYERYAENRPNTSQLANAVNSGRGLP
ncbi:glutathione S-transferase [Phyllosticta capitalensis]